MPGSPRQSPSAGPVKAKKKSRHTLTAWDSPMAGRLRKSRLARDAPAWHGRSQPAHIRWQIKNCSKRKILMKQCLGVRPAYISSYQIRIDQPPAHCARPCASIQGLPGGQFYQLDTDWRMLVQAKTAKAVYRPTTDQPACWLALLFSYSQAVPQRSQR